MTWAEEFKANVTTAEQLRDWLHLTDEQVENIREEIKMFPMSVTRYYLSLIDPDDPADPIRKMAIPSGHVELLDGYLDTSGEHSNTKAQGLQHKYEQTTLVLTTPVCAMFCRHCFRRRLVGKEGDEIAQDPSTVAAYIKANPSISNVLLSGGDSFMMTTPQIASWLETLTALDQLDFIRFGSRTPVTFPQRILLDPALVELLARYTRKKQIYLVTHFNHPREITEESTKAIKALQSAGVVVKNQTVLMQGINDDARTLSTLLKKVSALGIVQHYIFQCRPVQGVKSRFQVPLLKGSAIVTKALAMQNGLGKTADYTMSHITGKIRILGQVDENTLLFQYKQAKDPANIGRIFTQRLGSDQMWLPDVI